MDTITEKIKPYDSKFAAALKILAFVVTVAVVLYFTWPLWGAAAVGAAAWLTVSNVLGLVSSLGTMVATSPMIAWAGLGKPAADTALYIGAATIISSGVGGYFANKYISKKFGQTPEEMKGDPDYGDEDLDDDLEDDLNDEEGLEMR